jgi:hypothetical protein
MLRANLPWSSNTAIVASGSVVTVSGPIRLTTACGDLVRA